MCLEWKFLKLYGAVLKRCGMAFSVLYVLAVGVLLVIKVMTDLLPSMPWAEVFYGPALTTGSCYLLFCLACWVDWRTREKA